jgi:hypothetical protein
VALRRGDHVFEQAAVGLLDVNTLAELRLGFAKPERERIADALELGDVENSRSTYGAHPPFDSSARKSRGEHLAEPPLEAGDLLAEVIAS